MNNERSNWIESWHVNPAANKDYDFIDGLRGIAILLVLACHLVYVNPLSSSFLVHFVGGVFSSGAYGVTIFFALSGFLIAWPFWKRKARGDAKIVPPGYGWRRFWKIYPPLAASILIFTPIYIYRLGDWSFIGAAFQWLLGLPLLLPVSGKLNPVMWSLAVEVQFYIVLPLLFVCLKRVSMRMCLWIIPSIFLLVPILVRWLVYGGCGMTLHPWLNVHFPSMLDSFALGILMAGLECSEKMKKSWARLGDVGLVLLVISLLSHSWLSLRPLSFLPSETVDWMTKIASGLLLFYCADPQYPRLRWLCQPWLRWFGILSYELYLVHQPIALWARASFGSAGGDIGKYVLLVGGSAAVSIVIAALAYKKFSLPILKSGRSKHTHNSAGASKPSFAVARKAGVNAE